MTKNKKGSALMTDIINKNKLDKLRNESVLSPSAQYGTLCVGVSDSGTLLTNVYSLLYNNQELSLCDKAVIECQMLSGARISQVLQIKPTDITDNAVIRIPSSKGSNAIVYTPVIYRQYWLDVKRLKSVIAQYRDRFYYYRLYRKYGIYSLIIGNVNTSVTHSLRHALMQETEKLDITPVERAAKIGHKSIKSQDNYLTLKRIESGKAKRNIK